jgi:hypothetical protein
MDDDAAAAADPGGHGSPSLVARAPRAGSPSHLRLLSCLELSFPNCQLPSCDASGVAISLSACRNPDADLSPAGGRPSRLLFLRRGRQWKDPPPRSNFGSFLIPVRLRSTIVAGSFANCKLPEKFSESTSRIVGRRLIVKGVNFANKSKIHTLVVCWVLNNKHSNTFFMLPNLPKDHLDHKTFKMCFSTSSHLLQSAIEISKLFIRSKQALTV